MPQASIQNQAFYPHKKVISISKNTEKRERIKYNKPYCIMPVADIAWVLNQAKSIQSLWNECWQSDRFGSRWVKLTTTLKASAFRLARKVLSAAGLFQFKRDTCSNDSRKTESWSIINLHGARRIKEFWNNDAIAATDSAIAATDSAIAATDSAIAATAAAAICSETIENTGVSEPLSNSSGSSQELLKEVPSEEVPSEEVVQEHTLNIPLVEKLSRDTKIGEKLASIKERCMKYAQREEPKQSFRESFITTYQWKINDRRFRQLLELSEESRRKFLEKFDNLYGIYRTNMHGVFDHLMSYQSNREF